MAIDETFKDHLRGILEELSDLKPSQQNYRTDVLINETEEISLVDFIKTFYSLENIQPNDDLLFLENYLEPFDNLEAVLKSLEILTSEWGFAMSPRRITVSSIGIIPAMIRFLNESEAHLAISLHTPFDEERRKLMPVQIAYPIAEVVNEIKNWDFGRQRRVSFEYILFKGLNDTAYHIRELTKLLAGIRCRINLIRFHPVPGTPLESPDEETITNFRDQLTAKDITTTIRASRGQDIYAACGLLSTKELTTAKQ